MFFYNFFNINYDFYFITKSMFFYIFFNNNYDFYFIIKSGGNTPGNIKMETTISETQNKKPC